MRMHACYCFSYTMIYENVSISIACHLRLVVVVKSGDDVCTSHTSTSVRAPTNAP